MKVLEKGRKTWYVGLRARCGECYTLVEFGEGDIVAKEDLGLYRCECPECDSFNYETKEGLQERG